MKPQLLIGALNSGGGKTTFTMVFFPASGFRDRYGGEVMAVGEGGYWWSAIPTDFRSSYVLGCYYSKVEPLRQSSKAYGNLVRPSLE